MPEYAILEAIEEGISDQPIFETIEAFGMFDKEFPKRVYELNKKYKVVKDIERLDWYMSFFEYTGK